MPKRSIDFTIGDYYHIYNRAVSGNLLFIEEQNYWFFISKIKKYLLNSADILAYCLMPNHYHFVVLLNKADLSRCMQRLAMSYTASFNKVFDRAGHLFQGRFQIRQIGDMRYLDQVTTYIHLNPVTAGMIKHPAEWDKSSYLEYIGDRRVDFINPKIVLDLYGSGNDPFLIENQMNYRKYIEELSFDESKAPGALINSGSYIFPDPNLINLPPLPPPSPL
jgi:putative transposase